MNTLIFYIVKFLQADLEKTFFCELWNFWNTNLAKKTRKWRRLWNRDKTAWIKYLTQMHYFSSFCQVIMILPCYIHSIYIFCIICRLWRWHFAFCTFKDPKLAGKWTNFAKNLREKKFNSAEFVEFVFFQVCLQEY